MITDLKAVGSRIIAIRKAKGMTQAEAAAAANISSRAYADIERGTKNMRVSTMLKICQVLHISPNDLFTDEFDSVPIRHQELLQRLGNYSDEDKEKLTDLLHIILKLVENGHSVFPDK